MAASNKRAFENVTEEEFFSFLDEHATYERVDHEGTKEIVVDLPLPNDDRSIRIFSGIEESTGQSRPSGGDAIRNVIWDHDLEKPVGGRKHTRRIKTWRKNLLKKIEDMYKNHRKYDVECPKCGSVMIMKDGSNGEFWGCSQWPDCNGTRNV